MAATSWKTTCPFSTARLPKTPAEVEDFKGAIGQVLFLAFALHADEPLASRVDGELAEVADDPLAAQLFGDRRRRAGPTKEVRDDVIFVRRGEDDSFEEGFGFLC